MTLPILSFSRKPFGLSPWLIVGAAFILGVAVAVLTARNTQREKGYLIQNLLERGEALSWALEAGSRTGMHMGSRERGMLQSLVEETAEQPGIVFLAIVDSQGVILAHSDPKLVGLRMASGLKPARIDAAPSWRLRELGGASIFEVYRFFTPVVTPHHGSRRDRKDGEWMHGQQPSDVQQTEKRIIFVGLDQKPFTQALEEDYRNSVFAAATVAVMALVGFISLFWAYTRELKRLQAEVRRNDRLAALGNLAAGVAHEIRNPLSTIKVLATYLAKTMTPNGDNEETAKTMVGEIDRLNRVVSELLDFAHPTVPTFSQVDLNETIRRALRLADADIKSKNITARFMENPALHAVFLNPERFIQALLNLILNAVQSMDKGGDLTLSANTLPGKLFSVEISDTGRGMSKEVLADIFTPYFTTRASGTGLGLAIVQQIIEGHGGTITARSTLGKGSLFTITLPMRESSEE